MVCSFSYLFIIAYFGKKKGLGPDPIALVQVWKNVQSLTLVKRWDFPMRRTFLSMAPTQAQIYSASVTSWYWWIRPERYSTSMTPFSQPIDLIIRALTAFRCIGYLFLFAIWTSFSFTQLMGFFQINLFLARIFSPLIIAYSSSFFNKEIISDNVSRMNKHPPNHLS